MKHLMTKSLLTCMLFISLFMSYPASLEAITAKLMISPRNLEVNSGDKVFFELEVLYPENTERKDLRIEYQITNEDTVVAHSKSLRAIETQASFSDYLTIPQSAEAGIYHLSAKIQDYATLSAETSTTFHVKEMRNELQLYFLILLATVTLFGSVIFWEIHRIRMHSLKSPII